MEPELSQLAHMPGAGYYGVADLITVEDFFPCTGGGTGSPAPPRGRDGIRLLHSPVDALEDSTDRTGAALYRHVRYDVVNAVLDSMARRMANTLQKQGCCSFPVPAPNGRMMRRSRMNSLRNLPPPWLVLAGSARAACSSPDHGLRVRG